LFNSDLQNRRKNARPILGDRLGGGTHHGRRSTEGEPAASQTGNRW
jgi:hypothetical protein